MSNRIARMVPVEILQDDMVGFEAGLAFPVHELYGKRAFTDKVMWGEIWFADCSKRGMWWAGYVQDGQLYLDQSARNKFLYNRKHSRQKPTLMLTGTYKVWLDAWLRPGDYMYENDPNFTNNPVDGDGGQWRAPAPPARKYWQEVKITQPEEKGAPCRIQVRSRRFHWLYRVSRHLDLLDNLLLGHEKLIVKVDEARMYADYLREFLDVLMCSGSNLGHMASNRPQLEYLKGMKGVARNVSVHCGNFIDYGVCDGGGDPIPERKHINNVAHLLWALIHEEDFGREVALFDPVLAEEHRVLLARLGSVFNRVPRVFTKAVDVDDRRAIPTGRSFAYGREFAAEFTFPYYNAKLVEAGHSPAFFPEKPASTLKFVNSVRRYGVSMLNAASIFVVKEKLDPAKLLALIEAEEKVWSAVSKGDGTLELASKFVSKFRAAGKAVKVEKWSAVREQYLEELAAKRGDLAKLRGEIEAVRKQMEAQPQKIIERLKVTNPAVVYGVQSFEIFVKWAVAVSAWNAFRESAGEEFLARVLKGADAGIKLIDAAGTTLQFLGLHKVLRATWLALGSDAETAASRLKLLDKAGKGLGVIADIGSAALYNYDILFRTAYSDGLLDRYLPEDACSMYAWHIVTGAGKTIVAVGSGGAFLSKAPIFAKLQALGYLSQLIGEVGEALARHGAGEHKHFHDANLEVLARARRASAAVRDRGWSAEFYGPEEEVLMSGYMAAFEWIPVDVRLFEARLGTLAN